MADSDDGDEETELREDYVAPDDVERCPEHFDVAEQRSRERVISGRGGRL